MNIEDATADDFERALLHIRDNGTGLDNIRTMLRAQCGKNGHRITAAELAQACGWRSYEAANLHYGTFGRQVAEFLDYEPPRRPNGDQRHMWWMAVAIADGVDSDEGQFEFILRAPLAEAIKRLPGWL